MSIDLKALTPATSVDGSTIVFGAQTGTSDASPDTFTLTTMWSYFSGLLGTAAVLNTGTAANNIVQLDGLAKLPAVDGSALLNLPSGGGGSNANPLLLFNAGIF